MDPHDVRRVAVQAHCDPRTVERYLRGARQASTTQARVREALRMLGLGAPETCGRCGHRLPHAFCPSLSPQLADVLEPGDEAVEEGQAGVLIARGDVEPIANPTARAVGKALRASGVRARVKGGTVTVNASGGGEGSAMADYAGHSPDGLPPDAVVIAPRRERGWTVHVSPGKQMKRTGEAER